MEYGKRKPTDSARMLSAFSYKYCYFNPEKSSGKY